MVQITQVRKIKNTRRSVSGAYPFRGQSSIQFESTLERDLLTQLEFDDKVLDVIAQPAEIPFKLNGRRYHYTPDFLVFYKLGSSSYHNYPKPHLIEVKPEIEWRTHWKKWSTKWKAARRYSIEQGWQFQILDESRIRTPKLENIQFLNRYKLFEYPEEELSNICSCVEEMGSTSVGYLLARFFMGIFKTEGTSMIWHLLAQKKLACNVSERLSEDTIVWRQLDEFK